MMRALLGCVVLFVGCAGVEQVDPSTLTSGTAVVGEDSYSGPVTWRLQIDSNAISSDLLSFSGTTADLKQLRMDIPMRGVGDWQNDELKVDSEAAGSPDQLSKATVGTVDYVITSVHLVLNATRATGTVTLQRQNAVQGTDTDNELSVGVNFALGNKTCIVSHDGQQVAGDDPLCTTRFHR